MTEFNFHLELLVLATAVLSGLSLVVAVWALAGKNRLAQRLAQYERQLARAEKQVKTMTAGAVGMGKRILALESALQQLQKTTTQAETADGAYSQAMQLFEQGLTAETVATTCGLSSAEVSLMAVLHKHQNRAA